MHFPQSSGISNAIRVAHWKALSMLFPASIGSLGRFPAVLHPEASFRKNPDFADRTPSRCDFGKTVALAAKIKIIATTGPVLTVDAAKEA